MLVKYCVYMLVVYLGAVYKMSRKKYFALDFINFTMKNQLENFSSIICMDETHGTIRNRLDLTIKMWSTLAFFLPNRLNQHI